MTGALSGPLETSPVPLIARCGVRSLRTTIRRAPCRGSPRECARVLMSANRWAARVAVATRALETTSSAVAASVGRGGGPGSGPVPSEQFVDDRSAGTTVRVRRRGGRQREEGGSMDLVESFVEGHGETAFRGRLQWKQALEVAVDLERALAPAQREVAQPEVLDGQLSPDACGLELAVSVLGVHDGGGGLREVVEGSALPAATAASSSRASCSTV